MKLVALLPLAFLLACGRKEPIPQPEETTSLATETVAPASSALRPTIGAVRNGQQLRFVGRTKLRPELTAAGRLKAPVNSTEQSEKTP